MFLGEKTGPATGALDSTAPQSSVPNLTVRQVLLRYCTVWAGYSFAGGFLYGIYPIFLHTRGLNQFQIDSVLAIYFTVTFLTDIPTGAIADALGRRRSFVLGCALRALAFLIYFFAWHYPMFVLGETIDGVGTTFCNGAIDAWGVDALDQAGYAGLKDRLFSRISQLMNGGFLLSAIVGAYVANWNIAAPWLLGATGYAINAAFIARLMREGAHHHARIDFAGLPALIAGRIRDGLAAGLQLRAFLLLCIAQAIYFAAWAPYWLEWPQFFNSSFAVGIWIVGWLYALFTLARMLGAELMIWTMARDLRGRANRLLSLALSLAVLMYAGGALSQLRTLALVVFCLLNLCMGALFPLAQSWINEEIDSHRRATLLSFRSTCETLGGSIGLLGTGLIADRCGIPAAWRFAGLLSLATLPCYLALRARVVEPSARPLIAES